jgi:hypothetical protein
MRWGNWELVVSEHPPVLRNSGWSDVSLDDSDGYWGILGSVLDAFTDDIHEKSRGEIYVQTDRLLEALTAVYRHGLEKGRSMTPVEAAYSYAALHKG